jgi:hypothetical protein
VRERCATTASMACHDQRPRSPRVRCATHRALAAGAPAGVPTAAVRSVSRSTCAAIAASASPAAALFGLELLAALLGGTHRGGVHVAVGLEHGGVVGPPPRS